MNSSRWDRASGASAAGAKPTASKPKSSASSRMAALMSPLIARPSAAAAIGCDALLRKPQAAGRRARLIEDVDRHAAARIPITADAQPFGLPRLDEAARDLHRAILVKGAVIAERTKVKLQRLALDEKAARHIVDDEMREIRLPRDRTKRGEFGTGEAHQVHRTWMRIGHFLQRRAFRRCRETRLGAELRQGAVR